MCDPSSWLAGSSAKFPVYHRRYFRAKYEKEFLLVEKSSSVQEIELQNPDPGVHSRPQKLNILDLFLTTVLGLFLGLMISSHWSATTPTDQSRLALGTSAGVEDGFWSVPARRSPSRGSNSPEPPSPPHCFCTVRGAPLLRGLLVRIFFFWFIIREELSKTELVIQFEM